MPGIYFETDIAKSRETAAKRLENAGDVILNKEEVEAKLKDILDQNKGVVFLGNHYHYINGPKDAVMIAGLKEVADLRFYMPVTDYLLLLARIANFVLNTHIETSGIVTPAIARRKGILGLIYGRRQGEGVIKYMRKTREILSPFGDNKPGIMVAYPKFSRGDGKMGQLDPEEKQMIEGLASSLKNNKPYFWPYASIALDNDGRIIIPKNMKEFKNYRIIYMFGEPINFNDLPDMKHNGRYEGTAKLIHEKIKQKLPEGYR